MIKEFISRTGGGKSAALLFEAARQKGKKVAFISLEMTAKHVIQRLQYITVTAEKLIVFNPDGEYRNLSIWLQKKIEKLIEEFDIICVDAVDIVPNLDLKNLNNICFGNIMNQCDDLWISRNIAKPIFPSLHSEATIDRITAYTDKLPDYVSLKQIVRRIEHPLLPEVALVEAIDFENKEVKMYNMSNLLKNKQS